QAPAHDIHTHSDSNDNLVEEILFFFQAEDGIRDKLVTGVQTCALPILAAADHAPSAFGLGLAKLRTHVRHRVGHAGGMRNRVETVAGHDWSDPNRLEQDVVARVASHAPESAGS